jgi:hypothetical protein
MKRRKREIRRRKRITELFSRRLDETTVGFRVYAIPGKPTVKMPKKFTLVHPLKERGKRPVFQVRNDRTGRIVFESFKRVDAEGKQRELMAA